MNYGQVYYNDVANGVGCRTALFVSGCTHHCKGCFNEMTWDFNYGEPYTKEVEDELIESLKPGYIDGLTILGGEPMEISNQKEIRPLLERIKKEVPKATIRDIIGMNLRIRIIKDAMGRIRMQSFQ